MNVSHVPKFLGGTKDLVVKVVKDDQHQELIKTYKRQVVLYEMAITGY